jgi:hypothetical protein
VTIPLPVNVDPGEVLHFLGYPPGQRPAARIEGLLDKVVGEARQFVRARGAFVRLPVDRAAEVGLEKIDAAALVVGLVTAGERIEQRVAELLRERAATEALLLDAAGSAAVEEAADRLGGMISGDESGEARHVSCRISPGYGRWPIHAQAALFALLPHRELGVSLLPSMLMVPRKSISFAMWLGADARPIAGLSGCVRCELERCRYRNVAREREPEGGPT